MKWFSHQLIGLTAAMTMNMSTVATGFVVIGAVLPDVIDQCIARATPHPQRIFRRIHRGASHWYGWYLMLFLLGIWGSPHELPTFLGNNSTKQVFLFICLGLGFGGLSHIVLDMLTPMGVPYVPFFTKKRFSLNICTTGSVGEYIILGICLIMFFLHMT